MLVHRPWTLTELGELVNLGEVEALRPSPTINITGSRGGFSEIIESGVDYAYRYVHDRHTPRAHGYR